MTKRSIGEFLQDVGRGLDNMQSAAEHGEQDPLRLVDALLGRQYGDVQQDAEPWWELFGMDSKPTEAELDTAWRRWAAKNHPDTNGNEPAFRHMRSLYEKHKERLSNE